ncbi:MAG: hypothetical protein QGG73_07425, partial [Candidatus Hydrogenedentes bacterium]|nr:hypothetical protein [Candidatus Hydrogenedentota bacterium]
MKSIGIVLAAVAAAIVGGFVTYVVLSMGDSEAPEPLAAANANPSDAAVLVPTLEIVPWTNAAQARDTAQA